MPKHIQYKGGEYNPKGVFVFDFDGVLTSVDEHEVYNLDSLSKAGDKLLYDASKSWDINAAGVDSNYKRHLIFQHALWLNGKPFEHGPYLDLAKQVSCTGRLIVLTARSGWSAVERARKFLRYHDINVYEFYSVGRGKKVQQFNDIVREATNNDLPVYFFDDNETHIKDLEKEAAHNEWAINAIHVAPEYTSANKEDIASKAKDFFDKEVNEALKLKKYPRTPDPAQIDLFKPLSHARDLFVYHAGQRHTSIRYFQVAYGAVAAGYGILFTGVPIGILQGVSLTLVALIGISLCRFFIRLDKRNGKLVECDESAIKELEQRIGDHYALSRFSIMDEMEVVSSPGEQYRKNIDSFIFGLQSISWAGAFVGIHTIIATCASYDYVCIGQ